MPHPVPLDALSGVFSAIGFAGLIYGLSSIGEAAGDTAPVSPWIPLTVGVLALAVFTRRQLRLRDILLDLGRRPEGRLLRGSWPRNHAPARRCGAPRATGASRQPIARAR